MVYAFVKLNITDADSFDRYKVQAGEALAKHGGSPLVSSKESVVIEGDMKAPQIAVILSFPDLEAANAWINDPELQPVHEMRRKSGDVSILLLG